MTRGAGKTKINLPYEASREGPDLNGKLNFFFQPNRAAEASVSMRSYRVRSTEIIEIMRVSLLRSLARTASVNAVLVPGVSNRHHSPGHGAEGQMYAGEQQDESPRAKASRKGRTVAASSLTIWRARWRCKLETL